MIRPINLVIPFLRTCTKEIIQSMEVAVYPETAQPEYSGKGQLNPQDNM